MKTLRIFLLACSLFAPSVAQAAGVVIVNKANRAELDPATIRHLFLGRSEQLDRQAALVPILPSDDAEVQKAFYNKVLGKSRARYRAYWAKRVFTGDGIPPQEYGSAAVIRRVMEDGDCIGVVSGDRVKEGQVRVVHEF